MSAANQPQPRRRDVDDGGFVLALLSILALGGFARFYGLSDLPIWMDEAYSYFASTRPLRDILFNKIDTHPPLFYAIQHFWTAINPDIDAIRVPAAAIGSATVLLVAVSTADLASRRAGLAAAALLAASTAHIHFSQDARMYALLTFGLSLATWGIVGLAERPGRKLYPVLYLVGAGIAVYAQILALVALLIMNAVLLGGMWFSGAQRRVYLWWLTANVVLLILSGPWLISIPGAIGGFSGLQHESITTTEWFFRNIVGFPGIPTPFSRFADCLMVIVYLVGAAVAWRGGRRYLALISIGLLILYPTAIALLNLSTPIMGNKVFIPCVIPASILFGAAVAALRRPALRAALTVAVLAVAIASAIEAQRLSVNPEDIPQALALADAQGFADAPILAGHMLIAAEAHLYAPNREIFFPGEGDHLIRFDDRILKAFSLPVVERQHLDGSPMDRLQLADHLVADPRREWNSRRQVVVIGIGGGASLANVERLLDSLGFREVAAPALATPARVIFNSLWTRVTLWSRS